jgi:hypothetical protein
MFLRIAYIPMVGTIICILCNNLYMHIVQQSLACLFKMADESGMQASSSLQQGEEPEEARVFTGEDKAAKRRAYYAERDASKIYLFEQLARWRELRTELRSNPTRN